MPLIFIFGCFGVSGSASAPAEPYTQSAAAAATDLSGLPSAEEVSTLLRQAASTVWVLYKMIQDFFTFGNREVTPVEKIFDSTLTPLASEETQEPHLIGMWCPPRAELMTDFAAADRLFKDVAAAGFNMMWYYFRYGKKRS